MKKVLKRYWFFCVMIGTSLVMAFVAPEYKANGWMLNIFVWIQVMSNADIFHRLRKLENRE